MKSFLSFAFLLVWVAYASGQCIQEDNCIAAEECRCADEYSPISSADTPQFVVLSFNDAVSEAYYGLYYGPLLQNRLNPDGNPISATFYVPHEYTDYGKVNSLYNEGYEIAVHSITKNPLSQYWQQATEDILLEEFGGQRQILNRFANIAEEDITGARVPNFELPGDALFSAYQQAGIEYDATWTTMNAKNFFPFTLTVNDQIDCVIGTCATANHTGIWVAPIINLEGDGVQCNNLQACRVAGEAEEIQEWLTNEFRALFEGNRAPLNLVVSAAWFMTTPNSFEALTGFLDSLTAFNDVFIVSNSQVIEWARNPVPVSQFSSAIAPRQAACDLKSCPLQKEDETRYMVSCVPCPAVYPWLGNPLGLAQ